VKLRSPAFRPLLPIPLSILLTLLRGDVIRRPGDVLMTILPTTDTLAAG
jgi:hypothetical protein